MSTSRRQTIKEVRWTERRMREKENEPPTERLTFAQAMRELPGLILLREHGRTLPEGQEFYPPHVSRLLELCERAEARKSYRNAAKLAVRFIDAVIEHANRQAAKGANES